MSAGFGGCNGGGTGSRGRRFGGRQVCGANGLHCAASARGAPSIAAASVSARMAALDMISPRRLLPGSDQPVTEFILEIAIFESARIATGTLVAPEIPRTFERR